MSVIFEGYLGIEFDISDDLFKEIIETFIKQIENKFNYENLYFREVEKDLDIYFDSQIEFEECYEWIESLMNEENDDDKVRNFLIKSHFVGKWRVVGEASAGKIIKNSKEKKLKNYFLDFPLFSDAVLLATNNLDFSKGNSITTDNNAGIELIDKSEEKDKTILLIKVIGVFTSLLLFEKNSDDSYGLLLEKVVDNKNFPRSVKEALKNLEQDCEADSEGISANEEVYPYYYYELIYDLISNNDNVYDIIESHQKSTFELKLEEEEKERSKLKKDNLPLENIRTEDKLLNVLLQLGYDTFASNYIHLVHPLWQLKTDIKIALSLDMYGAPLMVITPTKILSKTFGNEIDRFLEDLINKKIVKLKAKNIEIERSSNRFAICVEFDSRINNGKRKILNWFFLDLYSMELYELNPQDFFIQKLDEAIEKTDICDQKPVRELGCSFRVKPHVKVSFTLPLDASKEEIYKELVCVLKRGGFNLEEHKIKSYNFTSEKNHYGIADFQVDLEEKNNIYLSGIIEGDYVVWKCHADWQFGCSGIFYTD